MSSRKRTTNKDVHEVAPSCRYGRREAQEIRINAPQPPLAASVARADCGEFADDATILREALTWWDLTEPDVMLELAFDLFGPAAVTAVAWCALTAYFDEREADYRFWFAVFARLGGAPDGHGHEQ